LNTTSAIRRKPSIREFRARNRLRITGVERAAAPMCESSANALPEEIR